MLSPEMSQQISNEYAHLNMCMGLRKNERYLTDPSYRNSIDIMIRIDIERIIGFCGVTEDMQSYMERLRIYDEDAVLDERGIVDIKRFWREPEYRWRVKERHPEILADIPDIYEDDLLITPTNSKQVL